jgi:hypothetical protein
MANPTNFIEMIPFPRHTGNSDPAYLNDRRAIEGELLMFTHMIKGSLPGDVAAGEALASSIKAASMIVYNAESTLEVISKLEALKIGYAPPVTIEQRSAAARNGGRLPISTYNLSKIKSPAMLNELNQFISGYKSKYPEPDGYSGIKSKLASDLNKLKNLMEKMRASWSSGTNQTTAASTPAATAAAGTRPSSLKKKSTGKRGSVAKLKKKNR